MNCKIVGISDTHCRLRNVKVPQGDLLLHAGDLTFKGSIEEISQELRELGRIAKDFTYGCAAICGNHDWLGEKNPSLMRQLCEDNDIQYLDHESIEIAGIKIFGSAYTPWFHNWAFNIPRGQELKNKWAQIPDDTQILVTHGPPLDILDNVTTFNRQLGEWEIEHVGCYDLYNRTQQLPQLKLHLFGHLHDGYGQTQINGVTYINASICTEEYRPTNKPIIFSLQTT